MSSVTSHGTSNLRNTWPTHRNKVRRIRGRYDTHFVPNKSILCPGNAPNTSRLIQVDSTTASNNHQVPTARTPAARPGPPTLHPDQQSTPASDSPSSPTSRFTGLKPALQGNRHELVQAVKAPGVVTSRRTLLAASASAAAAALAGPLVLPSASSAAALSGRPPPELGFEPRVVEFTLQNGLHFIVLPRSNAPVVSCHTYANVGAWNETPGATGMAHLLEHMAFKGTPRLGSVDFRREAPLLDALDEAFYELRDAKAAVASGGPGGAGPTRVSTLRSRLRSLQDRAAELAVPNAFGATLQRAGGVGLNATTSHDQTRYFVSLPSNKLELWMALEAERFRAPVFRELYSEKAVIEEERRLRVENAPMGRYQQEFALTALANNYRRPVIGFEQDFDAIGRREVQAFFNRFYGPANLTIAIVGDADPRVVRRMAERYWGDWSGPQGYQVLPRGSKLAAAGGGGGGGGGGGDLQSRSAARFTTAAAMSGVGAAGAVGVASSGGPQAGAGGAAGTAASTSGRAGGGGGGGGGGWEFSEDDPRPEAFLSGSRTSLRGAARSGPAALLGYYRPPVTSREGIALEVLADVLTGGRTSRLVSELVLTGRALSASVIPSYPGERHPGLALVYGVPREGDTPEGVAALLQSQLAALTEGGVAAGEMARVQRSARADLLAAAQSNSAMAGALAAYHVSTGSWRGLVEELELVTQLRAEEVRAVAERLFDPANCFTGYVLKA